MARASSLPERLRYLQPFRKKFTALPPEELNEDTGSDPLFALFSKRIKGLPSIEAEQVLEEDIAALRDWLSAPAQQNDPLQFAIGVFYIYSPTELVKHLLEQAKKAPEPTYCLQMDLPPDAKLRRVAGAGEAGMVVNWQGLLFAFSTVPETAAVNFDCAYAQVSPGSELVVSSVQFGEVRGTKYVRTGES